MRANRRFDELTAKGYTVNYEELKDEIIRRDEQDSTREIAPLKQAEDAVRIDTSEMTIAQVIAEMKRRIQEKI